MKLLLRLPLIVLLGGIGALAMVLPGLYAHAQDSHKIGSIFLGAAGLFVLLAAILGIATAGTPEGPRARSVLLTMLGTMALLPAMLAVPFALALPDTGFFNAWWEMISCLTTTGASLYSPELLPAPLHLWRALVGWLGGLFMLVAAIALLAPLRVGGFEIMSSPYGRSERFERLPRSAEGPDALAPLTHPAFQTELADPAHRVMRAGRVVLPVYAGLTLLMWMLLLMLGETGLVALTRAMGTLSTSGISPVGGPAGQGSGIAGEVVIFLFLIPALSRRFWPGGGELRASESWAGDPELQMAAGVVLLVSVVLFARHFAGAIGVSPEGGMGVLGTLDSAASAAWGGIFNGLSYLTTTGWNSVEWQGARNWSGLSSPGLMLAGLAMMGGGVATTAGGVKLLRVYALARHSERELERIVHPSSVGGGGLMARRLRREGAYLAFIFFMLFASSIAVTVMLISLQRVEFDSATILSIAALTNTGPLAGAIPLTPTFQGSAGMAGAPWAGWAGLPGLTKAVLAGAMIVGRVETLAILALVSPEYWRR
ncbi:TrkH family potassium uptake protein [Paracoccus sp. PS-1]|uniref:potassium transporter TrkG n=1 Tax=unclassified Paracoccus (in: a-proteobacteria) TaxID=2688777 RepID=UPI00048C74BD|nr:MULTISPECIES: potassium transporter TrkG [unclassified Paracoccus (in: a-proteobacteria)]MDQ7263916.1 TrkH family potassium uptake protein [Paracoccus sp. PS1]RQP05535.1 MAG: TrkH family potassium uptake protein [Paracoccus sp. BP8]UFM66660.1 TrkH family potassium uptake protein [Paracoccus sp. MA]